MIGEFCVKNSVILLSDEVYEHLCYERAFVRPAAMGGTIFNHTLSVGSLGKAFNATGWRVGHISGPAGLMKHVVMAHTLLAYTTAGPVQRAAARALPLAEQRGFWEENRRYMQLRVSQFAEVLRDLGLPVSAIFFSSGRGAIARSNCTERTQQYTEPMGVFFIFVSIRKVRIPSAYRLPESLQGCSQDVKVAYYINHELGVASIPGSGMYALSLSLSLSLPSPKS